MKNPLRVDLTIFIGAEGPKNVAMAAEIADGWFPIFYAPRHEEMYAKHLHEGFARPNARRNADNFEILAMANVAIDEDMYKAYDTLLSIIDPYVGVKGA